MRGDVRISGTVNASASGTTPGAGRNWSCTPAPASGAGANGSGSIVRGPADNASPSNAGSNGASCQGGSPGGGGGYGRRRVSAAVSCDGCN